MFWHYFCDMISEAAASATVKFIKPPHTHRHTHSLSSISGHCSRFSGSLCTRVWSNQQKQSSVLSSGESVAIFLETTWRVNKNLQPIIYPSCCAGVFAVDRECDAVVQCFGWAPRCWGALVERWDLYWTHCTEKVDEWQLFSATCRPVGVCPHVPVWA